ncbi:tautomerase family protein [Nostoc sp. 3335mG]|nr:tautomerase family protein [Nostoc sp. 3335mG]
MPLVRFDIIEGRSDEEITRILDASHEAMMEAFGLSSRDRFQIVTEHKPSHFRVEGTDLGLVRTRNVTIVSVTTHQRPRKEKFDFNLLLCRKLQERCGIAPTDVVINFVVNAFEDWSFGEGEPHYIRGPLAQP